MKIGISQLVEACDKSMRKIIQLDDLIENLKSKALVSIDEFDEIQEEFYNLISSLYGEEFLEKFFEICNSSKYLDNL